MRAIATDGAAWFLCTDVSHTKTDELIEMSFGVLTPGSRRNRVGLLDVDRDSPEEKGTLGDRYSTLFGGNNRGSTGNET